MNRTGLIVLQAVGALSILPYPFVLLANIMSIAATGQTRAGATPFVLLCFYPLVWALLYWIAWRAMKRGAVKMAFALSSVPTLCCFAVAGFMAYGWVSFARSYDSMGTATKVRKELEPVSPLLWAIWSAGGEKRFPPGPSLPVETAMRAMETYPNLLNVAVSPYGTPLKAAVANLSIRYDGTPVGNPGRQEELKRVVQALLAHGARFAPGEATLNDEWIVRMVTHQGPIRTASENPLVWRILTRTRDGVTIFSLHDDELKLLNTPTELHGTPLYAALLQDGPDAVREIILKGGHLSQAEQEDAADAAAVEKVLGADLELRNAYVRSSAKR